MNERELQATRSLTAHMVTLASQLRKQRTEFLRAGSSIRKLVEAHDRSYRV